MKVLHNNLLDEKLKTFCEKQKIWDYVDNARHYYDTYECCIVLHTDDWIYRHPNYTQAYLIDMEDRLYEIYSTDLIHRFKRFK